MRNKRVLSDYFLLASCSFLYTLYKQLSRITDVRSIPVLSSTRHPKVVVYIGEDRFVPFSSICSVMKISHYKYRPLS